MICQLMLGAGLLVAAFLGALVQGPTAIAQDVTFSEAERATILRFGPYRPQSIRDASNRVSGDENAIRLGERLFNDPRLSPSVSVACASCHQPAQAFADGRPVAVGAAKGVHNTPSLLDTCFSRWFGWAGANDMLWGASIRPITAAAAFPALEEMALDAPEEILMGFRLFEADLPLQSARATGAGYETWSELLAARTADGVQVRILLTDFEPITANTLHAQAWTALEGFVKAADAVGAAENLAVIAGLHPGELGKFMRVIFWPLLRLRLGRARKRAERDEDQDLEHKPGLQTYLRQKDHEVKVQNFPSARLWPATYHQKMAVFDGERFVIGGIDLARRMAYTPAHIRPTDKTWHDVSVAVAARAHLKAEWNAKTPRFNARLTSMGAPFDQMLRPVAPLLDDAPADTGDMAFLRTRSRRSRSSFAVGPKPDVIEIERALPRMILKAEKLIYLETQFLRSPIVTTALVRAAAKNPDAQLIAVLPLASDDVAFDGNRDADARQGEWLQVRAIRRIQKAWGPRCGLFTLAQPRPLTDDEADLPKRAKLSDAPIVYVHAKVTIIDGAEAIVGSANLNGRSMRWDAETAVHWRDAESVPVLQRDLWAAHFGDSAPMDYGDHPLAA